MLSPIATLLSGTGTHAVTSWVPGFFRNGVDLFKFVLIHNNEQALKFYEKGIKDVESARSVKDKFFKTTRRYVAWSIIALIALLFIIGGFTNFAFLTQSHHGWLLKPFIGPYTWSIHHFSKTFVLTPSIEQAMFYVLGFFLGVMGRR